MKGEDYQRPNFPATWARMHGKGRVFYTSLGHRDDVWTNPVFQNLLVGALSWATGQVERRHRLQHQPGGAGRDAAAELLREEKEVITVRLTSRGIPMSRWIPVAGLLAVLAVAVQADEVKKAEKGKDGFPRPARFLAEVLHQSRQLRHRRNDTPVFFVRDPMKFQHFIRSQKRRADNNLRDHDMQWDFWTLSPSRLTRSRC